MRSKIKYSILGTTLLVMYLSGQLFAQTPNLTFNYLSSLDGLSNNSVTTVLEDSRGFIWFATKDGLNQYNGYSFKIFKKEAENRNSLPDNHILCLAEDQSDNLWMGTIQSGVARYNIIDEKFYRYYSHDNDSTSPPGKFIQKIKVDQKNGVWVATDHGLAKYDSVNDNFIRYRFPLNGGGGSFNLNIRDLFQQSDDEIIIVTDLGMFKVNINTDKISEFKIPSLPFNSAIFCEDIPLFFDRSNNLWIGSQNGLIKYNFHTNTYRKFVHNNADPKSISSLNISSIFQDNNGNIWVGTKDGGVNVFNPKTDDFTVIKTSNYKGKGLSSNGITHIYEDTQRNMWFSTQEAGISFINNNNNYFEYFSHDPFDTRSISHNTINTFYEDNSGVIWVCPDDGIMNKMVNRNEFIKYQLKAEYNSPSILGLLPNGEHKLFVTGWGVGLFEFDRVNNSFKDLMRGVEINGKPLNIYIKGVGADSKGNLWLASHHSNGIIVYSPSENKFYNDEVPGPFNPEIMKVPYSVNMIQDRKERIWIVAYTGLYMYDGEYHAFHSKSDDKNTLGSDYLYTLFEDKSGQLWVGNSNGLEKIIEHDDSIYFERMNANYPLPNNIKGILQDDRGNLWLSSNTELTQFHPETKLIKHYKINKELPSPEFFERSCFRASNGEMYFGGTCGFFRFHPDNITNEKDNFRIYFTDFMLFNKSMTVGSPNSPLKKSILETKEIELSYNQSVISFEYAALNFNPYKTIEYAYKMEGFDKDWYYAGQKQSVTYTNLPSGEYTFKVRLADGSEISKSVGSEIKLIIHPPIWRSGAAYVIYFVVFLILLYLFRLAVLYREKLENELKLEKISIKNDRETNLMKLRFFTNISHEFRTPLTLINAPLEKLLQPENKFNETQQYHLGLIQKNSERLLKMVNQLMDYRKLEAGSLVLEPSHGDIVGFCKNIWSAFGVLAEQKQIKYTFHSKFEKLEMSFDPDKLDKILSNILSNAFKFTEKYGSISVNMMKFVSDDHSKMIEISVKDSGIGISEKDLNHIFDRFYSVSPKKGGKIEGTGIGLTLAKELTELHKGNITVRSALGEGAEFIVRLPIICHYPVLQVADNKEPDNKVKLIHESNINEIDLKLDHNNKGAKPIILLVEDDDELRDFIKNELKNDYQIILARNGEEGLRKASLEIPNLVLSDVMMPVMDGFELCKTLKADERTSHLPVILLTARQSHQQQLEGFDAGADDYVFKPFSVALLKSRVHNLLNNRSKIIEKFNSGKSLSFDNENADNRDTRFIQRIIGLVLENISEENINADYIANKLLVSRSLVYLKIEAMTGQSVNEFVRNIRLKKSLRLLEQKNMTITEIATAVGFSSQSYYTRSFKKQYGVSPKGI
jgi:signal transduction histidine kinase/ligand-binding sensor domain-containing protein/DNA-binding response OmpR family regulator